MFSGDSFASILSPRWFFPCLLFLILPIRWVRKYRGRRYRICIQTPQQDCSLDSFCRTDYRLWPHSRVRVPEHSILLPELLFYSVTLPDKAVHL